jgi:thiosulfate/3-mercaptopyruvate sulfurtransferase
MRNWILSAAIVLAACAPAQDRPPDSWSRADLIQPAAVAAQLHNHAKPPIFFVGFPVLYRGAHIPGAAMTGPASKPEGIELLRRAVAKLPRESEIVIYCGCCPMTHCPNIRPAYRVLREMGFQRVRVLDIATNMAADWIGKGYPVVRAVPPTVHQRP